MIRAGRLRSVITVQQRDTPSGGFNAQEEIWRTFNGLKNIRAEKLKDSGSESDNNSGTVAISSWRFRVRYIPGLTTEHRIIQGGDVYDILDIEDINERGHEHIIQARKISRQNISGA